MSEIVNPDQMSDVVDYSGKSIAELSDLFAAFAISEDRIQRNKEAEALKSAFYKTLLKEREKLQEDDLQVLDQVEENFKTLYAAYKKERAEWNRRMEACKEENLKIKKQVIEDLKLLLEKEEDVSATMSDFREIQRRWRECGPVPVSAFRDLNSTYQLYVEQFYDRLNINRELRDLDFKKNLEAKTQLCLKAEELAATDNTVEAFNELQKLHDAWKELGPVAKQYREEIWERFRQATTVLNKKYQEFYENLKQVQTENLAAKQVLCEKVEEIASREITDSKVWNALSKEIEQIQQEWRKIGFATKKENQKIYDRFRAACDAFYNTKREFYSSFKNELDENYAAKLAICEAAEALKDSKEWKSATDKFIELQRQWRAIGAVPRKKSDAIWKRFRAACDEFFAKKEKEFGNRKQHAASRVAKAGERALSEKDRLVAKYNALEQEIATKENNILFFAGSKAGVLVDQMRESIEKAKEKLAELEEQIRAAGASKTEE